MKTYKMKFQMINIDWAELELSIHTPEDHMIDSIESNMLYIENIFVPENLRWLWLAQKAVNQAICEAKKLWLRCYAFVHNDCSDVEPMKHIMDKLWFDEAEEYNYIY